jgi:hypothetical protein
MGQGDWGAPPTTAGAALGQVFLITGLPPGKAGSVTKLTPRGTPDLSRLGRRRIPPTTFPASYWDPDFLAMLTIAELNPRDWTSIKIPQPPTDPDTEIEVDELIQLQATERAALMSEIIEQNTTFMQDFLRLLMMTPTSRPYTYLLLKTGARVAELTMPYFKNTFNRPRPSQVCPWIMPPLEVAGHPSYPQGHGLMAHLKALCVSEALVRTHPEMHDALIALADRIARNRVVAGFHYPSDSVGARNLASELMKLVRQSANFKSVVAKAKDEWPAEY